MIAVNEVSASSYTAEVSIPVGNIILRGSLAVPPDATSIVLFAHGSGSSRFSPRNRFVAEELNRAGLATLLFDLLTPEEETVDDSTAELRFNIELLAERLVAATDWLRGEPRLTNLKVGYFGASTGAAAALVAAAKRPGIVRAVVSRGGRPDLAAGALTGVKAPVLLIVGGRDEVVIELNNQAAKQLPGEKELVVVPGATHLLGEPGALEEVSRLAKEWFTGQLSAGPERGNLKGEF